VRERDEVGLADTIVAMPRQPQRMEYRPIIAKLRTQAI
jgi:hypothetical protein